MIRNNMTSVKRFLLIIGICFSFAATAQRDINHWQLSALGGGFYFNETIANSLDDIDEPGFYSLGLRIQKRLGTDFQIGLSFLENRMRQDFDNAVRTTDLHLTYNWDNGYLLSQRAIISPYHLLGAGFRSRGSGDEVNLERSRGQVTLENGIKVRLGDNWSTQVAFVLNWNSDDEQFDNVFDRGYNYGAQIGLSYHFGKVQTNYKGPVFNASRDFVGNNQAFNDLYDNYAYVALNATTARDLGKMSKLTVDSLRAMRDFEVFSEMGEPKLILKNGRVFQLIANENVLDSVINRRRDVYKISLNDLDLLKSPQKEKTSEKSYSKSAESEEAENLIDRQNRLIENQNEFIEMILAAKNNSTTDSSLYVEKKYEFYSDENQVNQGNSDESSSKSLNPLAPEDSLALTRVMKVDSAHVTQWKDSDGVPFRDTSDDTNRAYDDDRTLEKESKGQKSSPKTEQFASSERQTEMDQLQSRLAKLEAENQDLKEKLNEDRASATSTTETNLSDSDRALLEETKRRNDLLEKQIDATRELAEKNAQPTPVVIEDNRKDDRGRLNVQPGVVLPIGGRGSDKSDNKEILENQEKMQSRIDSLNRAVSELKQKDKTEQPSSPGTFRVKKGGVVLTPADSTRFDSTITTSAADTMAIAIVTDTMKAVKSDSMAEPDTLDLDEKIELVKEDLSNMEIEIPTPEKSDSINVNEEEPIPVQNRKDTLSENTASSLEKTYPVSVFFGLNQSSLSAENKNKLDEVAADLSGVSFTQVLLEGHTDKSGDASYNEMLSKKRANAVKDYLIQKGVSQSKISIKPLGSKKADQAYNENSRRVDILVK